MKTHPHPITFTSEQIQAIGSKNGQYNQLTFAVLLVFFKTNGRFPTAGDLELPQLIRDTTAYLQFVLTLKDGDWNNRTYDRFKQEIRFITGFRVAALADKQTFLHHCKTLIFPMAPTWEQALEQGYAYFKTQKLEPYSEKQLYRFLNTAHHQFETEFFGKIEESLSEFTKKALGQLIAENDDSTPCEEEKALTQPSMTLRELKESRVQLKIKPILEEIQKYRNLHKLELPENLKDKGTRKLFLKYYDRVLIESPSHIQSHKPPIRYAYLALFCHIRQQFMTDTLSDLLLKLLHRITTKAERFVDNNLKSDNKRVKGKMGTLLVLAKKSIDHPTGVIENTIYPSVSKERLGEIVGDLGEGENWYQDLVKKKALSLYSHNNRSLVWALLDILNFETDHKLSRFLSALNFLKRMNTTFKIADNIHDNPLKERLYDPILIKNLAPPSWFPFIAIKSLNHPTKVRMNWHALELALFERLESEMHVKNIWVKHSYRYRNPEEDLPQDFDENEDYYFEILGLPKNPAVFIKNLRQRLDECLHEFNDSILHNPKVTIKNRKKNKGTIKIIPFDPQAEPQNLELLKLEIAEVWPGLHLIDILKEADFRIGFTKRFEGLGSREATPKDTLTKRILLCAFGIGTNTGLKRMSSIALNHENYDSLLYTKKRFFTCQNVRSAIQEVLNAINKIRNPKVWGIGTTLCAGDSKKIKVWDQNLLVEWHARYGGRGVMIYWHVKDGLCVHSKLKTCSSSEVGAMIHGVLHHDTEMDLDKISVDTHGQSSIGFGFSELLDFDLLPRIKNINKQKLYVSSRSKKEEYPNLTDVLASDPVRWGKITQNYRETVRHAAALKLRTVEPDVMMKRLSADNKSNPVYQTLTEIGKASRTIFLCRYLSSEPLRIEINEALNVVERVNSIMNFIFYGHLGEITSNKTHDQELSLLCLHLLQVCMCYINTILVQTILADPKWAVILTKEDLRALSPLFHGHINPYGLVALDMATRLQIEPHSRKVQYG